MLETNLDQFWPVAGEEYLTALQKALRNKRLDCLAYISQCSSAEIEDFRLEIKQKINAYFRVSERPQITEIIRQEPESQTWGTAQTIELKLSNGRRQSLIIGQPRGSQARKLMLAIHGTHEDAGYFLGLVDQPRTGHACSIGFMLPYIEQGYIVACTDLPCFGSDYPLSSIDTHHFTDYIMQVDYTARLSGFSYMNEVIYRHMAAVDFLTTEYANLDFLGVTGFSLGAECAVCVGACDERIQAIVEYMGLSTIERRLPKTAQDRVNSNVIGSGFIGKVGDYWCLAMAICPRPYLRFILDEDVFVNFKSAQDMLPMLKTLYNRYDSDNKYEAIILHGGHMLTTAMADQGAGWCSSL